MPALVVWGMQDPYIPARFGRAYASALPHAELLELPDAGHWPWLDRPDVVDRLVGLPARAGEPERTPARSRGPRPATESPRAAPRRGRSRATLPGVDDHGGWASRT